MKSSSRDSFPILSSFIAIYLIIIGIFELIR